MNEPERTGPEEAREGFVALATLAIAVLLIVGAGGIGMAIGMRGGAHSMMWGGTGGNERTSAAAEGFHLDMVPAHLVSHYEHAREHASVYAQIPCFCGCMDMIGHRNLEDCFVTPDGGWDSHASGCQICIQESEMIMRLMDRGMGTGAIADRVIAEFSGSTMST